MSSHGYLGLAVLMFLGGMFFPVPAEIVLPLVGFLVFRGELSFAAAVAATTAGSVGGALAVYAVGYRLGEEALRRLVRRFGRYLLVGERDLDMMLGHFERHGGTTVLVGRLVPGAGSLGSVPAGLARMPMPRYLACTTVGCTAWNLAHIGLGWALGTRWHLVSEHARCSSTRWPRRWPRACSGTLGGSPDDPKPKERPTIPAASLQEDPVVVEVRSRFGSATGRFDRHVGKMASLPLRIGALAAIMDHYFVLAQGAITPRDRP